MRPFPRHLLLSSLVMSIGLWAAGCKRGGHDGHDHAGHDHAGHDHGAHAHHEHTAPHGGTAIELGEEQYHLELVADRERGVLSAYVLDGEMENFIRLKTDRIQILVTEPALGTIDLLPVANSATGETVESTSQFEATVPWLVKTEKFSGQVVAVTIRDTPFRGVAFPFPEGNHGSK